MGGYVYFYAFIYYKLLHKNLSFKTNFNGYVTLL